MTKSKPRAVNEPLYSCAHPNCKIMRTKAEGGTTFTVCDKHWDLTYPKKKLK